MPEEETYELPQKHIQEIREAKKFQEQKLREAKMADRAVKQTLDEALEDVGAPKDKEYALKDGKLIPHQTGDQA